MSVLNRLICASVCVLLIAGPARLPVGYELVVTTGDRMYAGTDAIVTFTATGNITTATQTLPKVCGMQQLSTFILRMRTRHI